MKNPESMNPDFLLLFSIHMIQDSSLVLASDELAGCYIFTWKTVNKRTNFVKKLGIVVVRYHAAPSSSKFNLKRSWKVIESWCLFGVFWVEFWRWRGYWTCVISSFSNHLCFYASFGKHTIYPSVPNGECLADVKKESNRKRELRFPVTYVIRKSSRWVILVTIH